MTKRRLVIVIFLGISTAALILFTKLPSVVEGVASSKLEEIGATDVSITFADIGLAATQLGELSFVLERDARRYTISSRDIKASYTLADLFTGDLDALDVPEISVLVEELAGSKVSEQGSILSPDEWLSIIPFKKLNLELLKLKWRAIDGQTQYIELNGQLSHDTEVANARLDIQTRNYGKQRFELRFAPDAKSRLVLSDIETASKPVNYLNITSGAWTSSEKQLQADVGIDFDIQILQQQLQRWGVEAFPSNASGHLKMQGILLAPNNDSPSWQPKGQLTLQIPMIKNLGKRLRLDTPLEMSINSKRLQWQLGKETKGSLNEIRFGSTRIKSVAAKLNNHAGCYYYFEKKDWSCDPFAMALTIPLVKNKQNSITTSTAKLKLTSLSGSPNIWNAKLNVDIPDWLVRMGSEKSAKQIKLDRVHGSIDASNEKLQAKLAVIGPAGGATMHVSATHMMKNNAGKARYRLEPVNMQQHRGVLADTYNDWPARLAFDTGIIGVVGDMSWQQGGSLSSNKATLTMQNVGGSHAEITFSGLSGTLDAKGLSEINIKTRQSLNLAKLDVGTPITNVKLQAEIFLPKGSKPSANISDITMNVLGGTMSGQGIELDLAREQNPFTLQVSGVDVEELLKLEQKQGLFGSGIIDGALPLVLTPDGIVMQNGQLAARKPGGKLKYSANENVRGMAKTNAGVKLLVTAMEDFSYKVLEADVDYTPDGLLKMKVRLEGSNPELEGGRPVHINVDIEDNILQLLRSLRLASEISEKIGEQVEKRQSVK